MIKLFVMDVDGTLTDGKIYVGENGELMKAFSVKDGYAIHCLLKKNNIIPAIITGRISKFVELRSAELDILEVHQGVADKAAKLIEVAKKYHLQQCEIAYMGDDDNDLEAMQAAGLVGCPADASENVKNTADFISIYRGGEGAVREFVEKIVKDCL